MVRADDSASPSCCMHLHDELVLEHDHQALARASLCSITLGDELQSSGLLSAFWLLKKAQNANFHELVTIEMNKVSSDCIYKS